MVRLAYARKVRTYMLCMTDSETGWTRVRGLGAQGRIGRGFRNYIKSVFVTKTMVTLCLSITCHSTTHTYRRVHPLNSHNTHATAAAAANCNNSPKFIVSSISIRSGMEAARRGRLTFELWSRFRVCTHLFDNNKAETVSEPATYAHRMNYYVRIFIVIYVINTLFLTCTSN